MIEGLDTRENCYLIELEKSGPITKKKLRSRFLGKEKDIKQTLNELRAKGYVKRFYKLGITNWEVDHV